MKESSHYFHYVSFEKKFLTPFHFAQNDILTITLQIRKIRTDQLSVPFG
jgi:hypothetical protein